MTLFLDGIPSAGGPRSRRSRGLGLLGRTLGSFSVFSAFSLDAWLVGSVKGRASLSAGASAPSSPRDFEVLAAECLLSGALATYTTGSTRTTSSATTASSTAACLSATTTFASGTSLTSTCSTLSLLGVRLGLASKLDRDFALENFLTGELSDSTLSLAWGRQVDKGISDRAVGARVLWDGGGFTMGIKTLTAARSA